MGRKAVKKKRNKNPKRREKYLEQLIPIFYEFGLKALSMDDLCEKLEVSKATLYNYFATKEEMVAAILENVLGEIGTFESIIDNKALPFLERYFTSVQILTKSLAGISNSFLSDLQESYSNLYMLIVNFREYAALVLDRFFKEGIEKGIIRNCNVNILVLSDRLFFNALTDATILNQNNLTMESAFREYFTLKCFGMIDVDKDENIKREAHKLLATLNI